MYLFDSGSTDAFFCPLTGLVVDLDAPPLDENLTGLVCAVDLGRLKMVMVMGGEHIIVQEFRQF